MHLTGLHSDKGIRDDPSYRFIIGPTIAWKPSANMRFDVSPLFGVTRRFSSSVGLRHLFLGLWRL